jgi:predicted amidophosphoribosyltransferase
MGTAENLRQREHLIPTFSLFRWTYATDPWVSELVYALKGGGLDQAYAKFASRLAFERHLVKPELDGPCVFVPAPARRMGARDHAFQLARFLGEYWKAPVVSALERVDQHAQKRLMREQRQGCELKRSHEAETWDSDTTVIFVDDLITTGATAIAAFKALGAPRRFEVWTLACREQLATTAFL